MKRHLVKSCCHSVPHPSFPSMFITFLSLQSLFMQMKHVVILPDSPWRGDKLTRSNGYKVNTSGLNSTSILKMPITLETLRAQNYKNEL